jgi:hypothetical protein
MLEKVEIHQALLSFAQFLLPGSIDDGMIREMRK